MGSRLGWTVGITQDDLVGAQCGAVIGLAPRDEDFLRGERYVNVWHGTQPDAQARQEALSCVPFGRYKAMAVSPLESGRLPAPKICLVYATPGQMIILINGLQYRNYKIRMERGRRNRLRRQLGPGVGDRGAEPLLPCFAERRYGGVPDEEMLMALSPADLRIAVTGMRALAKNGLRYPIPPYGIQNDPSAGMGQSYAGKK
ncbi:DUF169 domain-containing protein [Siccirubricoccus deserti]